MKKIIGTLFIIFTFQFGFAQDYTVLHVKGKIQIKGSESFLQAKDKLGEKDEIIFVDPAAMAVVIHPKKGRLLLKASKLASSGSSELKGFVQNTLVSGTGRMSTRPGKLTSDIAFKNLFEVDHKEFFNGNFVFIDQLNRFQVSLKSYPMNGSNFFFIRYEWNGEEINKMLPYEGDQFVINQEELFKVDGTPIKVENTSNFHLYYRNAERSESRVLCSFHPIFINKEHLKDEISVLLPFMQGLDKEAVLGEILGFMADAHGKVDEDQLAAFMAKNFPKDWNK